MDYKKSHRILWICLIGALALSIINCVLAYVNESAAIVGIAVAVLVAAAGIIQAIRFFRCPYCGKLWRLRGGIPKECPNCGKEIR